MEKVLKVMSGDKKWYVLRARYGQGKRACSCLQENGIDVYYPLYKTKKREDGKLKTIVRPLLPCFIFVHSTIDDLNKIFVNTPLLYQLARYFRDKTKNDNVSGKNPPLVVGDKHMNNFQKVVSVAIGEGDKGAGLVRENNRVNYSYKIGDMVRVIGGPYIGVVGKVARINGQQRIVVEIPGVCRYATQYIATPLLEPYRK